MVRILRAFAWLRWRMLINSLEKTSARDTLERFSIAMEKLGPIMAAVLMIPSTIALAAVASASGYGIGRGDRSSLPFEAIRYMLLLVPIASIVGPFLLPAADRTNPVRMLLLPIPRGTLYAAQAATALGDVWIVLTLPIVLFVPLGLAVAGALGSALVALAAGLLLVAVVVGLSALATSLLHLIARDRRRGELLALLFILIVPALSMLPGLLHGGRHPRGAERREPAREEFHLPGWAAAAGERAFTLYPTELYIRSIRASAVHDARTTGTRFAALALTAVALHAFGMFVFARVLDSPGASGARRSVTARDAWNRTLPGLTPGASAVALAQMRLALRTPRGRSIMLSPLVMMGVFGAVVLRRPGGFELGPFALNGGLGFASFTSFICLIGTLPIVMNQFAVDKAGMTLALLSPLSDAEYLAGKAIGNAFIAFAPAAICLVAGIAIFRNGSPVLWSAIPLALIATYVLVSAPAAILSALFPRLVDLNSIGRGSNAHGVAGVLGLLSFVVAGGSNLLIVLLATAWLGRPGLVPVLLVGWCAIAFGISRLLFIVARRIFAARRENLALLLSDR
jgi:hypothetical protein